MGLAQRLHIGEADPRALVTMSPLEAESRPASDARGDAGGPVSREDSERASLSPTHKLIRGVGLLLGIGLFAYTLRDLDARTLGHLLSGLGPACLLILVPQAVGMALHTAAWRELLAALRSRASFFALGELFVGTEAVRMALPAGPAIAESVAAWGVKSRFGVPWTRSLAALAAKKAWVLCTHALCLVLLLVIGGAAFSKLSSAVPGGFALTWVTVAMAAALALTGAITLALLASRRAGRAVTRLLSRMPLARVRGWAEEQRRLPHAVAAASIATSSHLIAALYMMGQWITEIAETWLVLRLVGIHVTFTEALVIELGGSMVKSLAFVVPGGLGVQDASYVSLIHGLGVRGGAADIAAFILLKRAKDVFYVALGLGLFTLARKKRVAALPAALLEKPL